jgi:hypothetical protein
VFLSNATVNPPLPEHFDTGIAQTASLEEVDGAVAVVGYPVSFDEVRQLWFADIHIAAGNSYCPFVRLALARYQPQSIENVHVSHVVLSDFVKLAPDRTVTIVPTTGEPDRFNITVEGLTYKANSWTTDPAEQNVLKHLKDHNTTQGTVDEDGFTFEFVDGLQPPVHPDLVQLSVERRIPGTKDDAGWEETVSQAQVTAALRAGDPLNFRSGPLWTGHVTLDKDRTPGQFRVVVKEFEHYLSDDTAVQNVRVVKHFELDDVSGEHPDEEKQFSFTFFPGRARLVFAETIEL